MGTEIERRFRVNLFRLCPNGEDGKRLPLGRYYRQAYLATDPQVRVRLISHSDAREVTETSVWRAELTIKGKGTLQRPEFNIQLDSKAMAVEMMTLAKHGVIEKVRHELQIGSTKWELDMFLGPHEGLWLARRLGERFVNGL